MGAFGYAFRVREAQSAHCHRGGPGTFRAHCIAIHPETMRSGAITTAGKEAFRVCLYWSRAPMHRTRPTGRLA